MAFSSYEAEPTIELTDWSVYEVPLFGPGGPWTRHFVGYDAELAIPHVSSTILGFDSESGIGAAANHRIFQLIGQSGLKPECARLWDRWKVLNAVTQERDVTQGVATSIRRRSASPVRHSTDLSRGVHSSGKS